MHTTANSSERIKRRGVNEDTLETLHTTLYARRHSTMAGCERCDFKDDYELNLERELRILRLVMEGKRQRFWLSFAYTATFLVAVPIIFWEAEHTYRLIKFGVEPKYSQWCLRTDISDSAKIVADAAKMVEGFMAMSGKALRQNLVNGVDDGDS
ncbi:hypothetical protein V494_04464 [Pseudogymnoascus sp. VKM F-4513 (FW-928)]|nr:hypothetical protein V494_04464 [Pseudogymnoascus sp. VKM F-4513 (FW-928)]